jgi:hypothetical protein
MVGYGNIDIVLYIPRADGWAGTSEAGVVMLGEVKRLGVLERLE